MQKNSSPKVILAIAPGKRELGVTVFIGADLVYSSVKTIRHRKSRKLYFREIAAILRQLFEEFSITIVVIKALLNIKNCRPI